MSTEIKKYAIVVNDEIINVIMWDEVSEYEDAGNLILIDGLSPEPGIGWVLNGKEWENPIPAEPAKDAKPYPEAPAA